MGKVQIKLGLRNRARPESEVIIAHPCLDNLRCRASTGSALEKQVLLLVHEDLTRSGKFQATMGCGEGKDMGQRATAEMGGRPVRAVSSLLHLLKVPERPINKAAAVPKKGENS